MRYIQETLYNTTFFEIISFAQWKLLKKTLIDQILYKVPHNSNLCIFRANFIVPCSVFLLYANICEERKCILGYKQKILLKDQMKNIIKFSMNENKVTGWWFTKS